MDTVREQQSHLCNIIPIAVSGCHDHQQEKAPGNKRLLKVRLTGSIMLEKQTSLSKDLSSTLGAEETSCTVH
jgi:hypothetical protein